MMRKLVWTEGLFVTQHHFQQLDRYHEELVAERLRSLTPWDWGVTDLDIDERSLAANQIRVLKLSAVLPGGMPVSAEDGRADAIPPRSFAAEFLPQAASLDVYVGLAHQTDGAPAVDLDGSMMKVARYARVQERAADVNTGTDEQLVERARPLFRLLFGDEVKGPFDAIRIGQLVRDAQGAVQLRPSCVPPVLRIGASAWLVQQLRGLLGIMTGRQRTMSQARRQRTAGAIEFDASDAMRFWFLDLLNGAIPVFSHMVESGAWHPERAYLALSELYGRLCSFADADPSAVPRFNYLDLGAAFEPLFHQTGMLLSSVISDRYSQIPLVRREDGVYVGSSSGSEVMRSTFFLAVSGSLPEAQLRDRLPKLMKVASVNQIGAILKSAMNGAQLELEYRPPASLPVRPGVTFFRIARTPPEFWADIAATGTFALYHPFDPQSIALALYAVESTSST